jgi:hypothetical protein
MAEPTYASLVAVADGHWVVEGPNSGGVGGWLLVDGGLYEYHQGFGPLDCQLLGPITPADFLDRYGDTDRPRLIAMVVDLRARCRS